MPITVAHQPSAYGVGAIAFEAGKGQWRQQQQENALRQAALYLQGLQQQQGYQLAQQRNALDWAQLQSQNQRFDAGLLQNAWNSQNELDAQNQWRRDQLSQQQNLWEAQRQREQLEWDQRRQMHAEDMTARQGLEANRQGFEQREFDRRQELELNAVGQKLKAKFNAERALIEANVTDQELKEKMIEQHTAKAAGVDWKELTKPPEETPQETVDKKIAYINGIPVQVEQRAGGNKVSTISGLPTPLDYHEKALKTAEYQLKAYETWMNANAPRLALSQGNPAELAKYEQERQSMMPQQLNKIKQQLMRELQQGEGEQAPPQGDPQQAQQPQLPPKQQEQISRLESVESSAPPLVQDAARKLKAAAMSGSQVTPELEQAALMVKSWLSQQQPSPTPPVPQPSGYVMPPADTIAPPTPPQAPPVRVSNPEARNAWFQPEFAASGF